MASGAAGKGRAWGRHGAGPRMAAHGAWGQAWQGSMWQHGGAWDRAGQGSPWPKPSGAGMACGAGHGMLLGDSDRAAHGAG